MVDAGSYMGLSDQFGISGVPATIINGHDRTVGAVPEGQLFEAVRRALAP